jgi:hypothetical protein
MRPTVTYRLAGPGEPVIHCHTLLQLIRFLSEHRIEVTGGEQARVLFRRKGLHPDDLPSETIELITSLEPVLAGGER